MQNQSTPRHGHLMMVLGLLTFISLAAVTSANAAEKVPRPNIVLFMADDLGWADVPWHGSNYNLPNLEQLAANSGKLEAHYVHPMCSATRAALVTGRYASRFGVTGAQNQRALPWDTVTLASALKSAGYDTGLFGKWHLGSKPEEGPQKFGFDRSYGSFAGGVGPYNHRYKEGPFTVTWHRDGRLINEEGHVTDLIAQEAVQWLEQRGDDPFFLYVPFTAIHVPIVEPDRWHQMNSDLTDPAERLRAACTSHMDHAVGRVLATLDAQGLRDNTLVIFLSDNGAHGPSVNQGGPYPGDYGDLKVGNDNHPLRGHKSGLYEGGIRTPALVSWPGKLQPRENHTPFHAVDWMPTLCALAGVEMPEGAKWDGQNIWPALNGEELPDRTIYSSGVGFRSAAIRHGDWKLITFRDGSNQNSKKPSNRFELYNIVDDPGETTDLAAVQPDTLAKMRKLLAAVSERDRDAVVSE